MRDCTGRKDIVGHPELRPVARQGFHVHVPGAAGAGWCFRISCATQHARVFRWVNFQQNYAVSLYFLHNPASYGIDPENPVRGRALWIDLSGHLHLKYGNLALESGSRRFEGLSIPKIDVLILYRSRKMGRY
jgi:hypothetical protein